LHGAVFTTELLHFRQNRNGGSEIFWYDILNTLQRKASLFMVLMHRKRKNSSISHTRI